MTIGFFVVLFLCLVVICFAAVLVNAADNDSSNMILFSVFTIIALIMLCFAIFIYGCETGAIAHAKGEVTVQKIDKSAEPNYEWKVIYK